MPHTFLLEQLVNVEDPLSGVEEVDLEVLPQNPKEKLRLEYDSPGGRYKLETYQLTETDFGHFIWDYAAEDDGKPFLARENAIWISYGSDSYETAIRWHEKAKRFLDELD